MEWLGLIRWWEWVWLALILLGAFGGVIFIFIIKSTQQRFKNDNTAQSNDLDKAIKEINEEISEAESKLKSAEEPCRDDIQARLLELEWQKERQNKEKQNRQTVLRKLLLWHIRNFVLYLVVLVAFSAYPLRRLYTYIYNGKEITLSRKMEEIVQLNKSLDEKKYKIEAIKIKLEKEIALAEQTIRDDKNLLGVTSYEEAMEIEPIALEISAIQRKKASIAELEEAKYYILKAKGELRSLWGLSLDNLYLVKVFDEKEVAALAEQVDKVLAEFSQKQGKELSFESLDEKNFEGPEKIWAEINDTP